MLVAVNPKPQEYTKKSKIDTMLAITLVIQDIIKTLLNGFGIAQSMKRRILVLATTFPRWEGDTEPGFVHELSRRLNSRFEVIVLAPHHKNAKRFELMHGLKVHRFRYFFPYKLERLCYQGGIHQNMKSMPLVRFLIPFFFVSELLNTLLLIRKYRINLMHAHWILPQGLIAAIIKKLFGVPYIVTAHAGDIFPLKSKYLKFLAKLVLENADFCTTNSTYTRNSVKRISKIKNIDIVPMGVDLAAFGRSRKNTKKELKISGKMILAVGRLAEKKGMAYLIMAMPNVLRKFPGSKLVIVGDGSEKQPLLDKARELSLQDSIIFVGNVKNERLPDYYSSADVFVGPSIITKSGDTEGLGVVFLESLASGTPVIGSNVGGIPDIIKNGKTGLLVPEKKPDEISNAIIKILSDRKLSGKLAANGQKHVKTNYSWETVSEGFIKIMQKYI